MKSKATESETDLTDTIVEGSAITEGEDTVSQTGTHVRPTVLNTKPLFKLMVDKRASDLFFTSYAPIKIKIEGRIMSVNKQMLTPDGRASGSVWFDDAGSN